MLNLVKNLFQNVASSSDGYILDDQIIYNVDGQRPTVVKGMAIFGPSFEMPVSGCNQVEDEIRAMLPILEPEMRLQVKFSVSSDYQAELLAYYNETQSKVKNKWTEFARNKDFLRYSEAYQKGKLRRDRTHYYLSMPFALENQGEEGIKQALELSNHHFKVPMEQINKTIRSLGGASKSLDNTGLFEEVHRHLNPSITKYNETSFKEQFQPDYSIFENSLASEMVAAPAADGSILYDSHHHGFLVLKSLPQLTYSGLITQLTNLPIDQFSVTLNIQALETTEQITIFEKEVKRLENALRSAGNIRVRKTVEMKHEQIQNLMSNKILPFKVQVILHAWAADQNTLKSKLSALKSGVSKFQGAKAYEISLPTTSRNFFFSAMPGMPHNEADFWHYIEDAPLVNLIPITAPSRDLKKKPEALFMGNNSSLVAVNTFQGDKGSESPIHAIAIGQTGSGKSCGIIQLLTETEYLYDYTIILDDGNSYGNYVRTLSDDAKTLCIQSNGSETLNYLDTAGSPLSPQHLADATLILFTMTGSEGSERADYLQTAILSQYLNLFYRYWYQQWQSEERVLMLGKLLITMEHVPNNTRSKKILCDRYTAYQDWCHLEPEKASELIENITEAQIAEVLKNTVEDDLMMLSFSLMDRYQQPTHSHFCDWLEKEFVNVSEQKKELSKSITLLNAWRRSGRYGKLFDGVSTIDYQSGKVLHIEMGKIPDDKQLRAVVPLLISNAVMKCMILKPRSQKKRVVVEELGSFLRKVKGAKQLMKDFYERFRRYNVFCISVIQQISNLPEDIRGSVLGNVRQAFIFKQKHAHDLFALQQAFDLADTSLAMLKSFLEPSKEHGASFLHWQNIGESAELKVCFNIASAEMLYVSSSSGEDHERREKNQAKYNSPMEEIEAEAPHFFS